MSYSFDSVPSVTIKEISRGAVDIIDEGKFFALYNNGDRWMTYQKDYDIEIKQMYSSYDLAYGDILVSGLGFGILALWLCSKPNVKSVTVVEFSEDVIEIFKELNDVPDKLNIIHDNMITYNTDKEYDVLLLDHYERQTFDWRLKDISKICKRIKHKIFWAWSLEVMYLLKMYTNEKDYMKSDIGRVLIQSKKNFGDSWTEFMDRFFPEEELVKNIPGDKINDYLYTYFNRKNLYKG